MIVRKCNAEICRATESGLRLEMVGYFFCLATVGETAFAQCPDCLARTLLAELGQPVETLAELRDKISLLNKSAGPSLDEGHDGMIWSV